jgi:hypothetical protein
LSTRSPGHRASGFAHHLSSISSPSHRLRSRSRA